jgi:hypothetical protein
MSQCHQQPEGSMLHSLYVAYHMDFVMGKIQGNMPFKLVCKHLLFSFYSIFFIFCTSLDHSYLLPQPKLDVGELTNLTLANLRNQICSFLLQRVVSPTRMFHNPSAWDLLQIFKMIYIIYCQKLYLCSFKTLIVIFKTVNCYACRLYI